MLHPGRGERVGWMDRWDNPWSLTSMWPFFSLNYFFRLYSWYNGYCVQQWPCRPGFNPRSSHTKDSKNGIDAILLNTQHYKIWIKGKVDQSREWSSTLCVVAIEKGAFGSPSRTVINFTFYVILFTLFLLPRIWAFFKECCIYSTDHSSFLTTVKIQREKKIIVWKIVKVNAGYCL